LNLDAKANRLKPVVLTLKMEIIAVNAVAIKAPTIKAVTDNVGPITGTIAKNGKTDDATPALTGKSEANSTMEVFDGDAGLGTTQTNKAGNWNFTAAALTDGIHIFAATATDEVGNVGATGGSYTVTVDTQAPDAPTLNAVRHYGNDHRSRCQQRQNRRRRAPC